MPGGDGTGPTGMGPMTGRGAGYCAGFAGPGYVTAPGRGFRGGQRGGGGRGWRNWFHATGLTGWQRAASGWFAAGPAAPTTAPESELDGLRQQAAHIETALARIRRRIEALEGGAAKD